MPEPSYRPDPSDLPADHPDVVAGRHNALAPAPDPAPPTGPLSHFDTDYLVKVRREMSPNPHDGTSYAHVVAFIRSLISRELVHPDRVEADRVRAEKIAADQKAKAEADLAAKQAAEKAALPVGTDAASDQAHIDLESKHAAEQQALARQHAADDLAKKQADERKAFDQQQADERAQALAVDEPAASPGPAYAPPPPGPPIVPPSRR